MKKEINFYPVLLLLLMLGVSNIPVVRYAIYLMPFAAALFMILSGSANLNFKKPTWPFVFLLVISTFSVYQADYHWAKQLYFIFCYTSVFIFFDFSKSKHNLYILNALFICIFLVRGAISGDLFSFISSGVSLTDSKSALESTYAFPLGLFAIYYIYKKNYLWGAINLLVAVVAFKRIVILGILSCLCLYLIPKKVRKLVLNPIVITITIVLGVVLQIELASGIHDDLIFSVFGISTDHLLMGRQQLWQKAINFTDFNYVDFLFHGTGHGVLTKFLESSYGGRGVLLHADFLQIMIEHGFLSLVIFSFLLNNHKSHLSRALSLYITILFATDNVLIYQHLMLPYLLLMNINEKNGEPEITQNNDTNKKQTSGILREKSVGNKV